MAYAGLGVLTLAGGAYIWSRTRDEAPAVPATGTRTDTSTRNRPRTVRVHAQGNVIGGRGGATIGTVPVTGMVAPIPAAAGVALCEATDAMLARRQAETMRSAKTRLQSFILDCRPAGFMGGYSANAGPRRSVDDRMEVDGYGCTANFVA